MSDLRQALGEIGSIRRQLARTTEFRGYGPATMAATGALSIGAAIVQTWLVPAAFRHMREYLVLWLATAVVGSAMVGAQMYARTKRVHFGMSNEMLRTAVEQFLPAVVAGVLLTFVLVRVVPMAAWMLPGLWQIIYSLGVFSSCRFLPRAMVVAGGWYLLNGLVSLGVGPSVALSPWTMGVAFGVGQLLVAGILLTHYEEVSDEG